MTEIKRFIIVCKKCQFLLGKYDSPCNVEWHPNGIFIFTCMGCYNKEIVRLDTSKTPTNKEEFIEELERDRLNVKMVTVS